MGNSQKFQNEEKMSVEKSDGVFLDSLASLSTTEIAPKPPRKLPSLFPLVIRTVIILILLSIMLYCVSEVLESIRGYKEADDIYDSFEGMMDDILSPKGPAVSKADKNHHGGTTENFGTPTVPEINEGPPENEISETLILLRAKLKNLRETNPDVIGWISIPGTVIDYPIVQTDNNDYYLDHSITGTYLKSGSIFVDYRNESDWSDKNTIIYGHNLASEKCLLSSQNTKAELLCETTSIFTSIPTRVSECTIYSQHIKPTFTHHIPLSTSQTIMSLSLGRKLHTLHL